MFFVCPSIYFLPLSSHRSTDLQAAEEVDGWVAYVSADDITGENMSVMNDGEIIVTKEVFMLNLNNLTFNKYYISIFHVSH